MSPLELGRQGGDLRDVADDVVDLSTCVNSYGPPQHVVDALAKVTPGLLRRHPYGADDRVAGAYATHLGVAADELQVGRGVSGLLWRLRTVARSRQMPVWVPSPGYTEYVQAFGPTMAPPRWTLCLEDVDDAMRRGGVVVVANPENASGRAIDAGALADVAGNHPKSILVVDESYADFVGEPASASLVGRAPDNVAVLRSVSKFHGLAGVRVGVCWSTRPDLLSLRQDGPWPVSALDAHLTEVALGDEEWSAAVRPLLHADADWLDEVLAAAGLEVLEGSRTHVRLLTDPPSGLEAGMLVGGVQLRTLGTGHGLPRPAVRVTAPPKALRGRVEAALDDFRNGPTATKADA